TGRSRHEPCVLLRDQGIPCLFWFEDAIAQYGVLTVVFDLWLLVPDIDEAARLLKSQGWTDAPPFDRKTFHLLNRYPSILHHRLTPPGYKPIDFSNLPLEPSKDSRGPTTTIILPAAAWNVPVEKLRPSSPDNFTPPLEILVDALIESLLDSPPDSNLRDH
ncbi:hypothetical protein GQ53DRAFT_584644, partial [Thozetella sp. PMI_491]